MTTKYGKEAGEATFKDLTTGLDLWELTRLAATMAFAEIVITFRSHMDKTGMNAEVENYHREFNEAAAKLNNLRPELDVALRSAPTFQAEQARAQAFGARSLNEFKKEHRWQRDESQIPYVYSLDLATNEELSGGHTIDKHVGKTDSSVAPAPGGSSQRGGQAEHSCGVELPGSGVGTEIYAALHSFQHYKNSRLVEESAAVSPHGRFCGRFGAESGADAGTACDWTDIWGREPSAHTSHGRSRGVHAAQV